jgi:hypothetical protein
MHVEGACRCHCWRSVSLPHHQQCQSPHQENGGQSKLGEERKQQKGMHTVKEADMLAAKIDLLLSRLNKRAHKKEAMKATVQAMDSQMTCEVCGEVGHSMNNYPKTREDVAYINNGFQQGNNNGWNNQTSSQGGNNNFNSNQPSLKDLVLGQAKINKNLTKKLTYNDKMLENINFKIEGLSSSVKNQLSFNKMIETQLAHIAASIPVSNEGKIQSSLARSICGGRTGR